MFLVLTRSPRRVEHFSCLSRRNPTLETRESEKELKERKNEKKKKFKSPYVRPSFPFCYFKFFFFFFFSFDVGPTCPFITLFGPFQPQNNLFCPGFKFIYSN